MGHPRLRKKYGGFSIHLYQDHEKWDCITMNGISAKVIRKISDPKGLHTSLPLAAGNSDVYLRLDKNGNPVQARVYKGRLTVMDMDWGHDHYNNPKSGGDGKTFKEGTVHIQEYRMNPKGEFERLSANAREMSEAEKSLYGEILKHFSRKIKI